MPCVRAPPAIECPGSRYNLEAIMKLDFRGVLSAAGIIGLCLVALAPFRGSAARVGLGGKLTPPTQPQGGETCHSQDPGRIPAGAVCTWVAGEAFENGGHATAPLTGT